MTSSHKVAISVGRIEQIRILLKRIKLDAFRLDSKKSFEMYFFALCEEALTHTSAKVSINHERLEFLGDAVLRLAASEFIERCFPNMKVGDRSALRAHLVSDDWLADVGAKIRIDEFIRVGSKAAGDPNAAATINAEAVEALIGALYDYYLCTEPIHIWLTSFWEKTSAEVLKDPHRKNSKSALQELSHRRGFGLPNYKSQENSRKHGDGRRFISEVFLDRKLVGKGWGRSRQDAEKEAAKNALESL